MGRRADLLDIIHSLIYQRTLITAGSLHFCILPHYYIKPLYWLLRWSIPTCPVHCSHCHFVLDEFGIHRSEVVQLHTLSQFEFLNFVNLIQCKPISLRSYFFLFPHQSRDRSWSLMCIVWIIVACDVDASIGGKVVVFGCSFKVALIP